MTTIRNYLLPVAALSIAATLAAGCGSSSRPNTQPLATSATKPATSPKPMDIEITSFGPAGHDISVDFQATNNTSNPQRFTWADYVLTAPDGSQHVAYRDPGSAPYDIVDSDGGSLVSGGIFQFQSFTPGHYQISYAGKTLQAATL